MTLDWRSDAGRAAGALSDLAETEIQVLANHLIEEATETQQAELKAWMRAENPNEEDLKGFLAGVLRSVLL